MALFCEVRKKLKSGAVSAVGEMANSNRGKKWADLYPYFDTGSLTQVFWGTHTHPHTPHSSVLQSTSLEELLSQEELLSHLLGSFLLSASLPDDIRSLLLHSPAYLRQPLAVDLFPLEELCDSICILWACCTRGIRAL